MIYIDDGKLALRAESVHAGSIRATVIEGGILKERKGINMPGADLAFKAMTEKDKQDIQFGHPARGRLHRPVLRAETRTTSAKRPAIVKP